MNLLLWRHAEACNAKPGQNDLDRCLTLRGEKQARRMTNWLRRHGPPTMHVIVSPAARCRQTARFLDFPHDIDERMGPEACVSSLLAVVQEKENRAPNTVILLVGHQPALGRLAACLLSRQETDWRIKKGALWWLATDQRQSTQHMYLKAVIDPGLL